MAAPAELLRWFEGATSLSRCCPRYFLFDAGASAFPGEAELLAALARQPGPDGSVRLHTSPRSLDAALTVRSLSIWAPGHCSGGPLPIYLETA